MIKYVIAALSIIVAGLAFTLWWQSGTLADLRVVAASQERSITALKQQAEQAREAAEVAKATAERERARAEEYDRLRESLIGGNEDAELPDWFVAWLEQLLGGLRTGTDD